MTVLSYDEPIVRWSSEMRDLWCECWRDWPKRCLGRDDAKRHPKYDELVSKVASYPTLNRRDYEEACFVRWLAYDRVMRDGQRCLIVDTDVVPFDFEPWDVPVESEVVMLDQSGCPCAMSASKDGVGRIIERLLNFDLTGNWFHVTDETILRLAGFPTVDLCRDYPDEAPMVHYRSNALQEHGLLAKQFDLCDKASAIRKLLKR